MIDWTEFDFATRAVRAGTSRSPEGEHSEALFLTSSYVFKDAAEAAGRFAGDIPGNIYSRFTNPTVRMFEERLAALEEGERCVATASGMGAIFSMCLGVLKAGDHMIASRSIFGTTVMLFSNLLTKWGIEVSFVSLTDMDAWEQAIRPNTKLLFLETPSNPLTELADIRKLADLAHAHDCLLAVDNCFCTPVLQQPLKLGADIVVHSATKFLDGQGRCMGGAVVGTQQTVGTDVFAILRNGGPTMSPFNAWVFLKGLETLNLRIRAASDTALALAQWLESLPSVKRVYHPGLASHPQHELAKRQQSHFGAIVSFVVAGGKEAAWKVIDSTRLLSITANLGDAKTTIIHPGTTTHGRLTPEQRAEAGIDDGMIRVAVGLEALADIQGDLQRGLG